MQIGDIVGFCISRFQDYNGGKITKIMCRVADIKESSSDSEVLQYTLSQDYHWPRQLVTHVTDVVAPYVQMTDDPPAVPGTQTDGSKTIYNEVTAIAPLLIWEPTAVMTNSKKMLAFLGEKPAGVVDGIAPYWSATGTTYKALSNQNGSFSYMGTIVSLPTNKTADRSSGGFLIRFNSADEAALAMSSANKIPDNTVSFTTLVSEDTDLILIGDEVIQAGLITQVDSTTWKVQNYLRGRYNTRIVTHTIGDTFAFVTSLSYANTFAADTIPDMSSPKLRGYPVTLNGVQNTGTDKSIYHDQPEYNGMMTGRGVRPLAPAYVSTTGTGPYTINVAPRLVGSKVPALFFCQPVQVINQTFLIEQRSSSAMISAAIIAPSTYIPAVIGNPATGIAQIAAPAVASGATVFRIYSQDANGLRSAEYIDIPAP